MRPGVVIINSTLAGQKRIAGSEAPPPFHHWGLIPGPDDLLLGHRISRLRIWLRRLLRGTDLEVVRQVRAAIAAGYRRIYLVTQPDIIRVLPSLRRRHPDLRVVTWAWVAKEVADWRAGLAASDFIFTLTPDALAACSAAFGADRCELEVLGSDPARYFFAERPGYEVGIFGLANRDGATARAALALGDFTAVASDKVAGWLGANTPHVTYERAPEYSDVFRLVAQCRVCWIPTYRGDVFPTGLTNLVDALLSGVPVVLSRTSPLSPEVLNLPGVHRYEPGNAEDLVRATREAITHSVSPGAIRRAATPVLDISRLSARVRQTLLLPPT